MSDRDEIAEVLAEHHGCEIMFTERGAETCTGDMLPRGSYESIAHAYRLHLAAVLTERERRVKAEALREAAGEWEALVQREKPPIRGSLWLRARAADLRDGGEG